MLLVYIKLVSVCWMPQDLVKTEPNLVEEFRGFGMKVFIRYSLKSDSHDEEKRNKVSSTQ